VRESNTAARRLYEKLGFSEIGRRKAYYHNPQEDAILYSKTLV
jgi:ribosomal-protein-alanine N-acetyltransferase